MFDSLSERLQDVFRNIRGQGRLTPETVEIALREIRMALLEADVNFKVVKAFIDKVRDAAVDDEVLKSLTPVQHVIRIVRDEMLALFGDTQGGLPDSQASPRVTQCRSGGDPRGPMGPGALGSWELGVPWNCLLYTSPSPRD